MEGQRYNEENASSLSIRGSLEAGKSSQNYQNAVLHHMHQELTSHQNNHTRYRLALPNPCS